MMKPGVPFRWNRRSFRFALIENPAPFATIQLLSPGAEIPVAENILPNLLSLEPRIYMRSNNHLFFQAPDSFDVGTVNMTFANAIVQSPLQ